MAEWFFEDWSGPARVVLMAQGGYGTLIVLLRVSGKRTLAKMNAFDFVITVATGSTLAAVILNDSVTLAEGATAFAMLVLMQYGVAWVAARSRSAERLFKNAPTVLVWRGELLAEALRRERVTPREMMTACRQAGVAELDDVAAVVLETSGEFAVIARGSRPLEPTSPMLRGARFEPGQLNNA